MSYLFLSEAIAASVLADLVTLLVPARSTVSAVVFPLAARTFSATLSLLLSRLLVGVCILAPAEQADMYLKVTINMNTNTMITNLLRSEVRRFKPGESEPLPEGSAGGLNAAARPEKYALRKAGV